MTVINLKLNKGSLSEVEFESLITECKSALVEQSACIFVEVSSSFTITSLDLSKVGGMVKSINPLYAQVKILETLSGSYLQQLGQLSITISPVVINNEIRWFYINMVN